MSRIYLDYAAATPIDQDVLLAMKPYLKMEYGNSSSSHFFGQRAKSAINEAREELARFLNCSLQEIVFTGGATEANNLAILGLIAKRKTQSVKPHIITSAIEHPAVLEPCKVLEEKGIAEVTYLPVNNDGILNVEDVKKAIKENTVLVSIMYANNEVGTIQPIAEIANLLETKIQDTKYKILFHTDAVQAANYLDCDVKKLGVDLLTLSSHKIYGPKGVGCLYLKEGTSVEPIIYGGGQERAIRPGTENVAGIAGFGRAIKKIQNPRLPGGQAKSQVQNIRIRQLRDKLIKDILKNIPGSKINGDLKSRLPNNINVAIEGVQGSDLVIALDQKGIAISAGSACSEAKIEPSHVLLALGLSPKEAQDSIRVSLGRYTNLEEIRKAYKILYRAVNEIRKN